MLLETYRCCLFDDGFAKKVSVTEVNKISPHTGVMRKLILANSSLTTKTPCYLALSLDQETGCSSAARDWVGSCQKLCSPIRSFERACYIEVVSCFSGISNLFSAAIRVYSKFAQLCF